MLVVRCPSCSTDIRLPDVDAGKTVFCPNCSTTFQAPTATTAPDAITAEHMPTPVPVATGITPDAPRSGRAGSARDDFDDERDDRPRRDKSNSAAVAAGMGAGMIVLIVFGVAACVIVPCLIALLVPAVQKVREAAARTQGMNNLKQVALAMHNHHDAFKTLPTPRHLNLQQPQAQRKPVELSWRVSILPFIEQQSLFQQFDKNSGWDSPVNSRFQGVSVNGYQSPSKPTLGAQTHYQTFTGPKTIFPDDQPRQLHGITDGTSNTLIYAEADRPVIWTKPDDMKIQPNQPLPLAETFLAAMADGSVRMVDRRHVSEATLRLAIDPTDGQMLPQDWDGGR